jgi:hypothetical protein
MQFDSFHSIDSKEPSVSHEGSEAFDSTNSAKYQGLSQFGVILEREVLNIDG